VERIHHRIIALSITVLFIALPLFAERATASQETGDRISGSLGFIIQSQKFPAVSPAPGTMEAQAPPSKSKRLNIIFELSDERIDLKKLSSRGAIIKGMYKNLIAVEVPIETIEGIIEEFDEIKYARLPKKFFPLAATSEGKNLTGANTFHNLGIKGQNVKVAVLDVGFKGLSDAQSNGDLPSSVTIKDYTGNGIEAQYKHGTACAEIIHDMAPDAQLYLIKIADESHIFDLPDYCEANGIDIISASIGTYDGPGDGTGVICDTVNDAWEGGILPVFSAGNEAVQTDDGSNYYGFHWKGTFTDSDGDNIHEFLAGEEDNVVIAGAAFDDDGNAETGELAVYLRWDDWPNANVDYDLYVYDYFTGSPVASSTGTQNGSQPPEEGIQVDITSGASYYKVQVEKKTDEPAGKEIELFCGGVCAFIPFDTHSSPIATSPSSIIEPATAENAVAVGAIDYRNWTSGPQEDFSSQGPTNVWAGSTTARKKPDICGPDGVSSYTYGTGDFFGTSAATPHVAGAGALILSMHPHYGPGELRTALASNAVDMGDAGKDNIYGWGRLSVNASSLNTKPVLDWTGEAGYQSDGLEPEIGYASTDFIFKIKYTDQEGDAPTVRQVYIDKNGDGDYSDTGEIADMTATESDYASGVIYTYTTNIPYSANSQNCSYYFRFSDGVEFATGNITQAISAATAINKPDVFQTLGISIDKNSWGIKPVPIQIPALPQVMLQQDRVKVTNSGDGLQTYSLKIEDEDNKDEWSHSSSEGGSDLNTYVLSAVFCAEGDAVSSVSFNEGDSDDIITDLAQLANNTKFAYTSGSQNGQSVTPLSDVYLYFRLDLPTSVSGSHFDEQHDLTLELSCQDG